MSKMQVPEHIRYLLHDLDSSLYQLQAVQKYLNQTKNVDNDIVVIQNSAIEKLAKLREQIAVLGVGEKDQ